MSVQPDAYLPATWSLDSSSVQAIETTQTDPKVRMDSEGLYVTDASGRRLTYLHAAGGAVDLAAYTVTTPPEERRVRWLNENGTVVATMATRSLAAGTTPAGILSVYGESQLAAASAQGNYGARSSNQSLAQIATVANDANQRVDVNVGTASPETLLNNTGGSSYARLNAMIGTSDLIANRNPFLGVPINLGRPLQNGAVFIIGASGYCGAAGLTGIRWLFNGVVLVDMWLYMNEVSSHKAFPTAIARWNGGTLPVGTYNLGGTSLGNLALDANDYWSLAIIG